MSMLVDLRKCGAKIALNELVEASKITKTWLRTRDDFEQYLNARTVPINNDLDAHLVADLFAYLQDELNYGEALQQYSAAISENRQVFVILLVAADRNYLLQQMNGSAFISQFTAFVEALNGEYYSYTDAEIAATVAEFQAVLHHIQKDTTLLVSIG